MSKGVADSFFIIIFDLSLAAVLRGKKKKKKKLLMVCWYIFQGVQALHHY